MTAAVKAIGGCLRAGQLIVLESTTYPGTTSEVVRPILETTGLQSGIDFYLAYSPERLDPGNAEYSPSQIPKVVGADDDGGLAVAVAFYASLVDQVVPVSSSKTAEVVKIAENVFRAVNVALVNELKIVYSKLGIDIFEVIAAAKTKPFGYMPFYPGPGLGGHCIPIDPFYLAWKARQSDIQVPLIERAGEINLEMPKYVVRRVGEILDQQRGLALSRAKVLIVGVAYKRNVSDIRESPALVMIDLLQEQGAAVEFHDPLVEVIPPNHRYPALAGMKSVAMAPDGVAKYDVVVIVADHTAIDWPALIEWAPLVVDTRNVAAGLDNGRGKIFAV